MTEIPLELIEAARCGDAADIEHLLEAAWPDAYRLARAIVADRQIAEDVAQEACVLAFRNIASLRDSHAFRTWFYRIVVREALRQKKLLAATVAVDADTSYSDDRSASIDLWRALATLGDKQRTVIVLHYFENLTSREIGKVLRIPEATVRFRLMAARRKLRPLLRVSDSATQPKGEELYAL